MSDTDPSAKVPASPAPGATATESGTQGTEGQKSVDSSGNGDTSAGQTDGEPKIPKARLDEVIAERNQLRAWKMEQERKAQSGPDPMTSYVARELALDETQAAKVAKTIDRVVDARLREREITKIRDEIMADPQYAELQPKVDAAFARLSPEEQDAVRSHPGLARVLYNSVKSELVSASTRQGAQGQQIADANARAKAGITNVPTSGGSSGSSELTMESIARMSPAEREKRNAEIKAAFIAGKIRRE